MPTCQKTMSRAAKMIELALKSGRDRGMDGSPSSSNRVLRSAVKDNPSPSVQSLVLRSGRKLPKPTVISNKLVASKKLAAEFLALCDNSAGLNLENIHNKTPRKRQGVYK